MSVKKLATFLWDNMTLQLLSLFHQLQQQQEEHFAIERGLESQFVGFSWISRKLAVMLMNMFKICPCNVIKLWAKWKQFNNCKVERWKNKLFVVQQSVMDVFPKVNIVKKRISFNVTLWMLDIQRTLRMVLFFWSTKCTHTAGKGAARRGWRGSSPPLSNQNIDVYFLSYSPTL